MDLQRKLELMKKYDFQGFGNYMGTFQIWVGLSVSANPSKEHGEKCIGGLYRCLEKMQQDYDTINFGQLQSEMYETDTEDFATLFSIKEALPKLRIVTDEFVAFFRGNNYSNPENVEVYNRLKSAIGDIIRADAHGGIRFRSRRLRLKSLLKTEPART